MAAAAAAARQKYAADVGAPSPLTSARGPSDAADGAGGAGAGVGRTGVGGRGVMNAATTGNSSGGVGDVGGVSGGDKADRAFEAWFSRDAAGFTRHLEVRKRCTASQPDRQTH